jgi:ABC-type Fe3+-siderophore transport system permease subunit
MKRSHLVLTLGSAMTGAAMAVAGAVVWLVLTTPSSVASAVDSRDLMPLVQMVVGTLWQALLALVGYVARF